MGNTVIVKIDKKLIKKMQKNIKNYLIIKEKKIEWIMNVGGFR